MTPFDDLVADHLRAIALALRHSGHDIADPLPEILPPLASEARPIHARTVLATLPSAHVDMLEGGNCVLSDEAEEPRSYAIFVYDKHRQVFRLKASIDAGANITRFVESAYSGILERAVDDSGRDNYVAVLNDGYLTQKQFLKILAASDECLRRNARLVIIPDTSRWLQRTWGKGETLEIRAAAAMP